MSCDALEHDFDKAGGECGESGLEGDLEELVLASDEFPEDEGAGADDLGARFGCDFDFLLPFEDEADGDWGFELGALLVGDDFCLADTDVVEF